MSKNANLHKAKAEKNDEFYTLLTDIEKELCHYEYFFKDKVVYLNCDDYRESNFWKYFEINFDHLGLKKLVATHFDMENPTYKIEMTRGVDIDGDGRMTAKDIVQTPLKGNGDFRSPESIEILKEADVVVTNPPFSLFREYIAQLIEYNKKFLVIGNMNAITYKEIFPLIKENKLWIGYKSFSGGMDFICPKSVFDPTKVKKYRIDEDGNNIINVMCCIWFTNIDHKKRHEELILFQHYSNEYYPKYDNYDAINVDKVSDIPCDYDGIMGVPIGILDHFNPNQFEMVGDLNPTLNNKKIYKRILIKRK